MQSAYSKFRAHDAFCATTTPITKEDIDRREAAGKPYSTRYTLTAIYRRRLQAVLPAAGRTALALIDALVEAGGSMLRSHLDGLGGRSQHTIGRGLKVLRFLQLVGNAGGAVTLREDWQEWVANIVELMPTYGNLERRIVREAVHTIQACEDIEQEAKEAGRTAPEWCAKRKGRAEKILKEFAPIFWQLHFAPEDAVTLGHRRVRRNGQLLIEELPELRRRAYAETREAR